MQVSISVEHSLKCASSQLSNRSWHRFFPSKNHSTSRLSECASVLEVAGSQRGWQRWRWLARRIAAAVAVGRPAARVAVAGWLARAVALAAFRGRPGADLARPRCDPGAVVGGGCCDPGSGGWQRWRWRCAVGGRWWLAAILAAPEARQKRASCAGGGWHRQQQRQQQRASQRASSAQKIPPAMIAGGIKARSGGGCYFTAIIRPRCSVTSAYQRCGLG